MRRAAAVLTLFVTLGACNAAGAEEAEQAPGDAIVAADQAMLNMAMTEGTPAAYREFMAPDARMFGSDGIVAAGPTLEAQAANGIAPAWGPFAVLMSCDGSLAVSQGTYMMPNDLRGVYNTVWQRQPDGQYRWIFDFGFSLAEAPDPLPSPPVRTAQCGSRLAIDSPGTAEDIQRSVDGSLAWAIARTPSGDGDYRVWLREDGEMKQVTAAVIKPGG